MKGQQIKRIINYDQPGATYQLGDSADDVHAHLERICKCDRILSENEIPEFGANAKLYYSDVKIDLGADECSDAIEAEYKKVARQLKLPDETYSMTKIEADLPKCVKFGVRSGMTHMHMQKFSILSRGYQGAAIAVAAIGTSFVVKPHCWTETVIDQVVEDGDTYFCDSYQHLEIDDRRAVTLLDMKSHFNVRNTHRVVVHIDDPLYAGTFRSEYPQDLHIAKALNLFFKKHDICVITSSVLNIGIWKCCSHFNIFDAQARFEDCEIDELKSEGTAKLIFVENLAGVLFMILEKSRVQNESFVLYKVSVVNVKELSDVPEEATDLEEPTLPPETYAAAEIYRGVVLGSYHLYHPNIPQEFHGRSHLVIALGAIVYSKLLSANKWTKVMIDLIVNQSNIYLSDLARVLGKTLDDSFRMTVKELLCDVVFGVYTAKIKVEENVFPGEGKKSKSSMDAGIREFFQTYKAGILDLKNTFYAIWKENNKYYLLDPYACDEEGYRVDPSDPEEAARYAKAACCVTMNSSIDQLVEILLENTVSKEKDPFVIHNVKVLYIKAGTDTNDETVVFRDKNTNRRPELPTPASTIIDECATVVEPHPQPRPYEGPADYESQYPELMNQIELFMDTFDGGDIAANEDCELGYKIANPHRLILRGAFNCQNRAFHEPSQGRQGLIIGLAAMSKAKLTKEAEWLRRDVNQIIIDSNTIYEMLVAWILQGAEGNPFENMDSEEMSQRKVGASLTDLNKSSHMSSNMFMRGLNHMDLSMLPERVRFHNEEFRLSWKMNVIEGEANPLANLGEALEKFFDSFDHMMIENNKLLYAVWQESSKYFVFNPYGNDKDGWRNISEPAAFFVVDSINELVDLLYGLFEFNDYHFKVHYVRLSSESHYENNDDNAVTDESLLESFEKYKIKFLPVTEDDLMEPVETLGSIDEEAILGNEEADEKESRYGNKFLEEELENLFEDVAEPEPTHTPERLNLALVTGIVKIEYPDENQQCEESLDVHYEKLKHKHPPPFVAPPARNLCDLLDIKLASKSAHSLLSRFSIDSRLAMKAKDDMKSKHDVTISSHDESKLISLPPKKYFYSKSLSSGLTPIRAVDEQYIRDKNVEEEEEEECRRQKKQQEIEMVEEAVAESPTECILPSIIPVGPCIMTPKFRPKPHECPDKKEKKCTLSDKEQEDMVLRKLVCSTENLLLELVLPTFKSCTEPTNECEDEECEKVEKCCSEGDEPDDGNDNAASSEVRGFGDTDDENVGIIMASKCLLDRECVEPCHYKPCYFSAILCVLAKINVNVSEFHGGFLDRMIVATNKISEATGKLRYKMTRCFRNFNILGARCNVILKQVRYADPGNYEPDALEQLLPNFLDRNQTGIVIFDNAAYAFWTANGLYYLFDPYPCDENGRAAPDGQACLLEFCNLETFITRILDNTGQAACRAYRLCAIAITHLEHVKHKSKKKSKKRRCELPDDEESQTDACGPISECPLEESESDTSLMELCDWVTRDRHHIAAFDGTCPGFMPIKNYNASVIEVEILENDITRPNLPPLSIDENCKSTRQEPYDRKFFKKSVFAEPMDLCIMAWAQIYEPPAWSTRTMQALFEASKEYTLDSILASEDTTVELSDDLLNEFNIANYNFRVVFAPMHPGMLYANEGWNLAMSLEKIFASTVYTGAVIECEGSHIGVMKNQDKYYAWWLVNRTKNIRMIVSDDMKDYLKLIVKEINQPEEVDFEIRVITISYAKIYGPDCSDLEGLHESMMPSSSLAKIHVKDQDEDFGAIFRPINCSKKPLIVFGSVALIERDTATEPNVKRCYFVALFSIILKRDIIQNPLPGMVDKVLELAECVYKLFEEPKYHSEHILTDVCLMGRVFEFRDCASELVCLSGDVELNDKNFIAIVKKHLKRYFKKSTSGIIHFTNCCYGFWYSRAKCCYYYIDPYQCNEAGKRVCARGKSCLFMFSSICEMVKRMCLNRSEETTGFFIHQIHVESVDSSACPQFQEDPMWTYLDYHWSYKHVPKQAAPKKKKKKNKEVEVVKEVKKPMFKNYLIEVPNSIYSVWGTLSAFDTKFGSHAGKNQAAICIAALAMQNLCHPSEWSTIVLDSAVICGDSYYKDSQKIPAQCRNQFNLTNCFRISPYYWDLEFSADMCGVLYCSNDQPNLADTMENGFKRSTNLVLRCNKKFIAVMKTTEAFYAIDPSWTGPPLFSDNRGAIYAIRTRNLNTLIYVVTKMLNTNQRLQFAITAVNMSFKQESCGSCDSKPRINRKKLLDKPARQSPGLTVNHACLVDGCDAVPDEDSYLLFKRHLKLGLKHGSELECVPEPSLETISTKKTCGSKAMKKARSCCPSRGGAKSTRSITSILNKTVGYPKILSLIKDIPDECYPQATKKHAKISCGPRRGLETDGIARLDKTKRRMDVRNSFVYEKEREMFYKYNEELDRDIYYSYKHGVKDEDKSSYVESTAYTKITSSGVAGPSILAASAKSFGEEQEEQYYDTLEAHDFAEDAEDDLDATYRSSVHIDLNITPPDDE